MASAAVFIKLIVFLVLVDREQGNPMVRVIKNHSSLDLMKRDFMDYEDLKVRNYTYKFKLDHVLA